MGFMDLFEDPFDTFVNMLLHFALFYTACSSTSHLNLLHIMPFTYIRYMFIVLFAIPKTRFDQLQVCISFNRPWLSCL